MDGEVIHPHIPVLASFLICFLTSFLFRVIRDPILLILASEGSHGIFYGPAARARGIDGWGSPRLLGTTARRAKLPLFYILDSRMLLFHVSHPILLVTPFLVFDRLGEYICGIAVRSLSGRCTSAISSAGSWPGARLYGVLRILNGPAARARRVIG